MSRIYKVIFVTVLVAATLACGLVSNPLSGAQNFASTAEAMASAIPSAFPSGIPDVTQYLNPSGAPVSDWNGIPIMTQATAGQEFNNNTYSFKASGITETDVETFYKDKLTGLGWTSQFGAQGGSSGGLMLFSKDSSVLTITVSQSGQDFVVILVLSS